MDIAFFTDCRNDLGESPVWDARRGWLWWVDIRLNRVMAADGLGVVQREWTYSQPVGSIGLAMGGKVLVAAFADHFALIADDGQAQPIAAPDIGEGAIRFNDGKADRQGRFLSGTMQHGGQAEALAGVWRLEHGGTATRVETGMKLANSLCFSPCGCWLYLSDTLEGVIRRYAYAPETGALGPREAFFDCSMIGAAPDGATVDSEGRLWVALVTTQQIGCISPEGDLLRTIDLPVPYPACPAFGGPDLATLYVTTIADSGHKLKSAHPDAGRMLAITGLGARGIAEAIYHT
ncbi:SMP-30/gluconolactonase/LRE family protein [Novosphingobium sp. KA1]|uniref:SMP-30/gluconolactonase/LRE family protein n=1 Tax=Novosphingobium sp. (strain KA1) TaxID=164608 RepID=UPI001F5C42BB|nr:SMP-30/gluconolactonase/LRE family protein [Novosphingobium sp. KA1]